MLLGCKPLFKGGISSASEAVGGTNAVLITEQRCLIVKVKGFAARRFSSDP